MPSPQRSGATKIIAIWQSSGTGGACSIVGEPLHAQPHAYNVAVVLGDEQKCIGLTSVATYPLLVLRPYRTTTLLRGLSRPPHRDCRLNIRRPPAAQDYFDHRRSLSQIAALRPKR